MRLLLLFFITFTFVANAQLKPDKYSHSFGDIYDNAPTYVDFTFKNESANAVFLLTIDKPQEIYYIYSKKIIQPDSVFTLRLKVNDNIAGRFNYTVDVYFSDNNQPVTLSVNGNIKEKSSNGMTDCPDFSKTPPNGGITEFEITIKVIDSLTREPIRKSKLFIVNNGVLQGEYVTNNDGLIHKKMPIGYYFVTAQHKDYLANNNEGYLNFQSNYMEIELQNKHKPTEPDPILASNPNPVLIQDTLPRNPIPEINIYNTPVDTTTPNLAAKDFNSGQFLPNNIVFIIDVSSSMNNMGKLDLLKMSMVELTKILRKEDRVTLIAYSGSVNIMLENVSAMKKEEIIEQVQKLVAKGYTAGGDAIKEGYRLAKKSFIPDGNNLIFMVTDGAFNKGEKNYKKIIKKNYHDYGIKLSVVGIKTTDFLTTQMREIAMLGGGEYVRIVDTNDARKKLFEEVKRTSFRG
jgi:Ca-activated chloride channel family protein